VTGSGASRSLAARMLAASILLALLVSAVFAVFVVATSSLRAATNRERRSKDVTVATLSLEKLVLDLDAGVRDFVVSGKPRLLRPWTRARPAIRPRLNSLLRLVADDPSETRRVETIRSLIAAYEQDYAEPTILIAEQTPAAVRTPVATAEGELRIEEIRRRFEALLTVERRRASASSAAAKREARRAFVLGVCGLSASAMLILLFGLYLSRVVARPVREVAAGASRLAGGELSTRLTETGAGEVGQLTRAFNSMAQSLEQGRIELEAQNERLRRSDRLKSELVSMVSHELRTPLTTILGFTNVMRTRDVDDEQRRQYLSIVEAQARRLAGLIDDFLDVQRIEEGRLELNEELVDLRSLLREEARAFAVQAEGHTFELELPEEKLPVVGDAPRLLQVVGNLLSNAVKYSPDGSKIELAGERSGEVVHIRVCDEGVGIAPEQQERIFTKFFRGDANARGIPGTGLGLALAREIVEAHGGRIGFTSALDEGSTFWVELPAAQHAAAGG
jgi:signal transduction histidine kinase